MFKRSELQRAVGAILRTANGPMANAEIAVRAISAKGWNAAVAALVYTVAEKVNDVRKWSAPCGQFRF